MHTPEIPVTQAVQQYAGPLERVCAPAHWHAAQCRPYLVDSPPDSPPIDGPAPADDVLGQRRQRLAAAAASASLVTVTIAGTDLRQCRQDLAFKGV